MENEQDLLLEYAVALDAGNLDWMIEVLRLADKDASLWNAIMNLHQKCGDTESYTAQVRRSRQEGSEQ